MAKGIDYAGKNNSTKSNLEAIKRAGYSYIGRYYGESNWKKLTREEAKLISKAGLYIVAVYQNGGRDKGEFTYASGKQACESAIEQAESVGQPYNTPIYFAVDFEADSKSELEAVKDYFGGVKSAMERYERMNGDAFKVGCYGSYYVVKHIDDEVPGVSHFWQCKAWSKGKDYKYRDLYQYDIDKDLELDNGNTILVDFNESDSSAGGFQV
ncbi:DUF1906 domain-containing protein [Brevibacillus sp. HB1.3]|uniref:DUF1906 domain-containing protein n=1 Tax=Brevibacillus sp. HB1.3 TaxID=2738842 RepID=UPI001556EB98|nr:DUF1906 domain-containing protein [Brevibacillus sp. HB1.3]NQF17044.1 DUF1906 domain-containing protein [Brevibacillus sp. HB1.3]